MPKFTVLCLLFFFVCAPLTTTSAFAQPSPTIGVRGFATVGNISLTAKDSFDAILGQSNGPIFGGGGQVLLPWGFYAEVDAWRFKQDGQRVFIGPNNQLFPLGIPVRITLTPIEVTGGWRFRRWQKFVPYGGVGYSQYRYKETSQFATDVENVEESFDGVHVAGGLEYLLFRWVGVGVEVGWSSIADAIGQDGVSKAFNEDNLGGTSVRLKISVGR